MKRKLLALYKVTNSENKVHICEIKNQSLYPPATMFNKKCDCEGFLHLVCFFYHMFSYYLDLGVDDIKFFEISIDKIMNQANIFSSDTNLFFYYLSC